VGMKRIKKLSILLTVLILITLVESFLVGAELNPIQQYKCADIRVLSNCSSVNLTEVTNVNTTYVINSAMTHLGGQTFNYSFCNTSLLGEYTYSWNDPCVDCSSSGCGNSFPVTATGQVLTGAKVTVYLLIFIIALLIFTGLLIVGIFMPSSNKRDQMTGYILAVENLKYVKYFAFMFAYLVGLFLAFFSYTVSYSYLDFPFITSLTYFIFYGMAACTLIFFPLMIYFMITAWMQDTKVSDLLNRGLKVR
jgi:hypothetical protein